MSRVQGPEPRPYVRKNKTRSRAERNYRPKRDSKRVFMGTRMWLDSSDRNNVTVNVQRTDDAFFLSHLSTVMP